MNPTLAMWIPGNAELVVIGLVIVLLFPKKAVTGTMRSAGKTFGEIRRWFPR